MKKIILLVIVVMSTGAAYSQETASVAASKFKTTFGGEFEFPKKHSDLGFLGSVKDGLVQLSFKHGDNLTLQKLDSKYNVTKTEEVDISKMPKSFISDHFLKLEGKYYWFFSTWDKAAEKEHLHVQEVDVRNAKLVGLPKDLITASKLEGSLVATGFYKFEKADKFPLYKSRDTSKIMFVYTLIHESRDDSKNHEVKGFNVYDSKLNKVWSKEVKMPYTEEMMSIEDYQVDHSGNAYLLTKVYKGKKTEKSKDGTPNYYYELLRYESGSGDLKKIPVKLDQYFINDIFLQESISEGIIIGGYYTNDHRGYSSDGAFLIKVDKDGNLTKVHKGYYEFPTEVLKQYNTAKTQKKIDEREKKDDKDVEAYELDLDYITVNEDGSILLTGEEYYTRTYTYTSSRGGTYTRTYYYFNDILTMKIGASGEMEWCRKIPKRQKGASGTGTMSYSLVPYNGDYYFFYTDNIKNLTLAKDKKPELHADGAGGFLVYSKIDKDGKVTKNKLFDYREKKVLMRPVDFERAANDVIINRVYDGRKSKVVAINLQ